MIFTRNTLITTDLQLRSHTQAIRIMDTDALRKLGLTPSVPTTYIIIVFILLPTRIKKSDTFAHFTLKPVIFIHLHTNLMCYRY